MSKFEELLELVRSMNVAEKKYFKRYASRFWGNAERKSISLFEQLTKAGSPQLKKNPKKTKSGLQNHLPMERNRLYQLILDSLQSFYAAASIDSQVYDLLGKVEVLHNRGFFDTARKTLNKARKLALRYQKYDILIGINQWEKRIMHSSLFGGVKEKELYSLFEVEQGYTRHIDEVNAHWKSASVFYLNYRTNGTARTKEEKKFYEGLAGLSLFKKDSRTLSPESEMYKMLTRSRYTAAISSYKELGLYARQLKELMENSNHLIYKDPFIYCIANYNYLFALMNLRKIKAFYTNLHYFKKIPALFGLKQHRFIHDYVTSTSINVEFNMILETGEFDKGIALAAEIEPLLAQWEKTNPLFAQFIFSNIAYCYFGEGCFREALVWNNKIGPHEESFLYSRRLFELMLHFELGNNELLFSLLRSFYRHLLSRQTLYKTESLFIHFLRKHITQLNTREEQVRAFAELRGELVKLKDDPIEKEFLVLSDLISWLESKIENRPFKEIIREKVEAWIDLS